MNKRSHLSIHLIWSCAVLFYLYQYILRVFPSVMADDLMSDFHISACGFSNLSAFALYCYGFMQIPAGMLIDHFGTRRITLLSILLCIAGVVVFSTTQQLGMAYFARMLMGTGSACAFLSVSKIINEWFPDSKKGLMMGLASTAGTIGALLGGAPLIMLTKSQGWRGCVAILAALGVVVLFLNIFVLPKPHSRQARTSAEEEIVSYRELFKVFKNTQAWVFALVAVGVYMSISVIADLWGVSFVIKKFAIEKAEATRMVSFIYIGVTIGCPLFPWVSRLLNSVRAAILVGGFGIVTLLTYIVFVPHIPLWVANAAFFGIGLCSGAEILCFTGACALMGPAVTATVTGFLNCIITLVSAIVQQNVGMLLDYFWDGTVTVGQTPIYSITTYQAAFGLIILCTLLSSLLASFVKKTISVNKEEMIRLPLHQNQLPTSDGRLLKRYGQ